LLKRKLLIFPLLIACAAALLLKLNLTAQGSTIDSGREAFSINDYSSINSDKGSANSSFTVSAEIIESPVTLESFVSTESGFRITVSPSFIVFQDRSKSAELTLQNSGNNEALIDLTLLNTVISETGERITKKLSDMFSPGRNSFKPASWLLKFSPRRVRLKPKEQQTVRISAIIPEKNADGEYKSELFINLADENQHIASNSSDGLYIPLMIRKGDLHAKVNFEEISAEENEEFVILKIKLGRSGNKSVIGNIIVSGFDRLTEEKKLIRIFSNIGVFHPAGSRTILKKISRQEIKNAGSPADLIIEFNAATSEGGDNLATTKLSLKQESQAKAK